MVTYLGFRFRLIMMVGVQSRNHITQEHSMDYNSRKGLGEAEGGLGGRLEGWWGLVEVRELNGVAWELGDQAAGGAVPWEGDAE